MNLLLIKDQKGQTWIRTNKDSKVSTSILFSYSIFDTESKSSSLSEYSPVRVQESVWVLGLAGRSHKSRPLSMN